MASRARKEIVDTDVVPSSSAQQATIPAPPSPAPPAVAITVNNEPILVEDDDDANAPVGRPTTVPDYDVEALAAASFHNPKRAQLPLDLSVPIRKMKASVCGAPLRAAFLLSHVDDRLTIAEIADSAQLPVSDAIENFMLLADLGVVELRGASSPPSQTPEPSEAEESSGSRPPPANPKSGLRSKA